jgi:hypothetical protein
MNKIQESVLRICKVLLPPKQIAYTIKDECLGTFTMDNSREKLLEELTYEKDKYNKSIDVIISNYDKYNSQISNVRQHEDMSMRKMGEIAGHIPDYMNKIHDMNLDEFTNSRLKGLIDIYNEINLYLNTVINSG